MSWDSYIDNLIAHGKDDVTKACIIGKDGSLWTTHAHAKAFKLSAEEAKKIGSAFTSKDFSAFQANGIYAEGEKYQFLREMDGVVAFGKKKSVGFISLQATKSAVVCAFGSDGKTQANANKAIASVAEYLESTGM